MRPVVEYSDLKIWEHLILTFESKFIGESREEWESLCGFKPKEASYAVEPMQLSLLIESEISRKAS